MVMPGRSLFLSISMLSLENDVSWRGRPIGEVLEICTIGRSRQRLRFFRWRAHQYVLCWRYCVPEPRITLDHKQDPRANEYYTTEYVRFAVACNAWRGDGQGVATTVTWRSCAAIGVEGPKGRASTSRQDASPGA